MSKGTAAVQPPSNGRGGAKKKLCPAYLLFVKAVREDMHRKFGGAVELSKRYPDKGGSSLDSVKMAVMNKMWTQAAPSVKAFFEHAAQRSKACDGAQKGISKASAGDSHVKNESEDDEEYTMRIGRQRPSGEGKAQKSMDSAPETSTGGTVASSKAAKRPPVTKEGEGDEQAESRPAKKKPGDKGKQPARKKSTGETPHDAIDTRVPEGEKASSKSNTSLSTAKRSTVDSSSAGVARPEVKASAAPILTKSSSNDAGADSSATKSLGATKRKSKEAPKAKDVRAGNDEVVRKESSSNDKRAVAGRQAGKDKEPGKEKQPGGRLEETPSKGEAKITKKHAETSKRGDGGGSKQGEGGDKVKNKNAGGREGDKVLGSEHGKQAVGAKPSGDKVVGNAEKGKKPGSKKVTADDTSGGIKGNATAPGGEGAEKSRAGAKDKGGKGVQMKENQKAGAGAHEGKRSSDETNVGPKKKKAKESTGKKGETTSGKAGPSVADKATNNSSKAAVGSKKGGEAKSKPTGASTTGETNRGLSSKKQEKTTAQETGTSKNDGKRSAKRKGPVRPDSTGKTPKKSNSESSAKTGEKGTSSKKAGSASSPSNAGGARAKGKEPVGSAQAGDASSLSEFDLKRGEKTWIEVEWEVEVQKTGRQTEVTLEWFLASVDLAKQVGTDGEGRPKWRINYSRRGSLPASKSKVAFWSKTELVDDYQDDPLPWRKKRSELETAAVAATSPKRPSSAAESVASSFDQEAEWRDDFGIKPRRR